MTKYFVSAILPGHRQLGIMQFEADNEKEMITKAESMCPSRAAFRSYEVKDFEDELPIDEFVSAERLKEIGY